MSARKHLTSRHVDPWIVKCLLWVAASTGRSQAELACSLVCSFLPRPLPRVPSDQQRNHHFYCTEGDIEHPGTRHGNKHDESIDQPQNDICYSVDGGLH